MKCVLNICFATIVILSFSLSVLAAVTVGAPAPDFSVEDTNGQAHTLSNYKGKFVVLEWFNHDCPFVRKHYNSGNMQNLQKKYTQAGVIWLSINSSAPGKQGQYSPAEANRLTQEKGVASTAVILDPEGTIGQMYGAQTTPHLFIIDPNGTLIYQGAIDNIASTDVVDIPKATNYVEAALSAAMGGKSLEVSSTKSYGCSVKY